MTIEVKIIADSESPSGKRITTFELKYPRFIHAEFMTHRALSRNASSSRAIPFKRQIEMIKEDMAMPMQFRKNQKGMQAGDALSEKDQKVAEYLWKESCRQVIKYAEDLNLLNIHKQYVNRLLEPYAHISVVVTATEWANFFALRYHKMAMPEICELAKQMWNLYSTKEPQKRLMGDWHLPYVNEEEVKAHFALMGEACVSSWNVNHWLPLIKRSVARCARVSYLNHDGTKTSQTDDEILYARLLSNAPIHASPAEHQAQPVYSPEERSGNFRGWLQYRQMLPNENITEFKGPVDGENS